MKDVTFCDNSTMETIVKNPENKEKGQNQPSGGQIVVIYTVFSLVTVQSDHEFTDG